MLTGESPVSDDTYTGNPGSDIDLINVIQDDHPKNARQYIFSYIKEIEQETQRDIPISKNVYQYSDLFHPYRYDFELCIDNKDYIELPIEILRIKDTGKIVQVNTVF